MEQLQIVASLKTSCWKWKENVASCVFGRLSTESTLDSTLRKEWNSSECLPSIWSVLKRKTLTLWTSDKNIAKSIQGHLCAIIARLGLSAWLLLGNLACPWLWALSSQRDLIGTEPESIHTQWVPWLPAAAHVSPRTYCPCRLLWVVFPSFAVDFNFLTVRKICSM